MRPKDPRAALISSGEIDGKLRESRGHLKISPPGMEMGQQIKTLGAKEKRMDSRSLAICDNYHLPRKNASYRFIILHRHLWGGRFQMSGVGERQVTGENGRESSD